MVGVEYDLKKQTGCFYPSSLPTIFKDVNLDPRNDFAAPISFFLHTFIHTSIDFRRT